MSDVDFILIEYLTKLHQPFLLLGFIVIKIWLVFQSATSFLGWIYCPPNSLQSSYLSVWCFSYLYWKYGKGKRGLSGYDDVKSNWLLPYHFPPSLSLKSDFTVVSVFVHVLIKICKLSLNEFYFVNCVCKNNLSFHNKIEAKLSL